MLVELKELDKSVLQGPMADRNLSNSYYRAMAMRK